MVASPVHFNCSNFCLLCIPSYIFTVLAPVLGGEQVLSLIVCFSFTTTGLREEGQYAVNWYTDSGENSLQHNVSACDDAHAGYPNTNIISLGWISSHEYHQWGSICSGVHTIMKGGMAGEMSV